MATTALTRLTRLRTVLTPDQMTVDLTFRDASDDTAVSREHWLSSAPTVAASLASPAVVALILFGALRRWVGRGARTRRRP